MRIKMPAMRIAPGDPTDPSTLPPDILTCGSCRQSFHLSDIVPFIQHKLLCLPPKSPPCPPSTPPPPAPPPLARRRPSISAPISGKRARVHTPPPGELTVDGAASSTPKGLCGDSPGGSGGSSIEEGKETERMEVSNSSEEAGKKNRTEVADAESNTTHSEPSTYTCSTCKVRLHSAWRLLQHVQNSHGIKVYVESSPSSAKGNNHSSSSASSTSSGCSSSGGPPPPMRHHLLPPPDMHNPFGVGGLLRLPLPPLNHPVPPAPLFSRPEHHYRIDQLVSEQFRHHGLNLAAAAAAVAATGAVPPPHTSFPSPVERVPPPRERSTPNQALSLEPQLDFYSQRLRQLAGTTSPGTAQQASSPSPRKLSPPFTSHSPTRLPPNTTANNISSSSSGNNNNNNNSSSGASGNGSRPPSASPPIKEEPTPITATPRSTNTPPDIKPGLPSNNSSDTVHACEYCGKKFRYQNNLEVHKRTHSGELPYKCTVCDHACAQSSKLKKHMKLHRTPEDRTSNPGSVETIDGEDTDEEEDIEDDAEDDDDLDEEEEAEDLSVPSQNNIKSSNQSASLVGELMDKFGLSNIAQYSEAYKQALQESNTALKMQLANKDRDNNNSTNLSNQLKLREEFAKGLLPNVAPPPQGLPLFPPFNDSYEASKRLKLEMERNDWWLPGLTRDGKGTPGPSALLSNPLIKKEASRRNDTCEFCGKVFKNCSNLTVHRRSHTGEKPYKCELCSYACAQSSKLTRHMKTHGRLGKDVYRCRFCEMPFSVPSTLEKHMRKCVVNQGKGHLLPAMPMLSADEDSSASVASKEAA